MKIGLYGGMANNMYALAKGMAAEGADVCFIRDRSDRYPFSQPLWDDVAFEMGYEEIPRASYWPWTKWRELEEAQRWSAPDWLYDPLPGDQAAEPVAVDGAWPHDAAFLAWYARQGCRAAVLRKMKQCHALVVAGVEGTVLAYASRRPFVIAPFGGDLMIAAGVLPLPPWSGFRQRVAEIMLRRQLVKAYRSAVCIGTHEPTSFATDFYGAEGFFRRHPLMFLAIPMRRHERLPAAERRQLLNRTLARLKAPAVDAKHVGFVPSRVDYEWKGQDRLLQALAALEQRRPGSGVHLVFSGWGADLQAAREFVARHALGGQVTFLGVGVSKPVLAEFFRGADFVVDQFKVGQLGTSALEAMACAAPVLMWVNTSIERSWGQPPVLLAKTAREIEHVLAEICDGRVDLDRAGREMQEWVCGLHHPSRVTRALHDRFAGALAA